MSFGWENDQRLWSKEIERHYYGEFSFSVVETNPVMEDYSQVVSRENTTFVGVYDGHGGPDAAKYVSDHFFNNMLSIARYDKTVDETVIQKAFDKTRMDFDDSVDREVAEMGSCLLVGVIWKGILFVATLGDSRAVISRLDQVSNEIVAEQLIKYPDVHPSNPQIVFVEGAIGNALPNFTSEILKEDPDILRREIQAKDQFIIFASNGLWEHLTNQEAVNIVHQNLRAGIARRLVVSAMENAANKKGIPYDDVKQLDVRERREVHDDISVIVVFIDHHPLLRTSLQGGFIETAAGSSSLTVGSSSSTVGPSLNIGSSKISDDDFP